MSRAATLPQEQTLAPLKAIVGEENFGCSAGAIVAAPGDAAQVAEILRLAAANHLTVTPTGGGTKLQWGNPVSAGIALNLRRLNRLREHAWQDLTCTVEAGCTCMAMQAALAERGQMAALDPLWPERATVGGIVATNDSGALRVKFGSLRDLIIGMTVVLADGTTAKSGGKVVKNVAGYDLHKLMTGSFGTLGVITEVNFRLHPIEEIAWTWTVTGRDAAEFTSPLAAIMDSQMAYSCVQLRARSGECALDVRMAGVPECFEEYTARIRNAFDGFEVAAAVGGVWAARQHLFDAGLELVLKVAVLARDICALASDLQKWASTERAEIAIVAQASGIMTIGVNAPPDQTIALVENLRARVEKSGGSAVAFRVPDALRNKFDVWGAQPGALPLMREIKRRFDPGRILNPGRFVGNI